MMPIIDEGQLSISPILIKPKAIDRLDYDLGVKINAPVFYVKHIQFVTGMDVKEIFGFASKSLCLCQTSDSRLYRMAEHKVVDFLCKNFVHRDRVWSWPNNGHFSPKNINDLGQFIQARFP